MSATVDDIRRLTRDFSYEEVLALAFALLNGIPKEVQLEALVVATKEIERYRL